jgi:hypothetical protein
MSRSIELISEMIVDSFKGVLNTQQSDVGECAHFRVASAQRIVLAIAL